jgi:hypothetical protein
MSNVIYAQVSFIDDFDDTLENVMAAEGHVDGIVVVEDGSFTRNMVVKLMSHGAHVVYHPWNDNFPQYRNASLNAARELNGDWVLISDADEHFNAELFRDLKPKIIPFLEEKGVEIAGIRCNEQFSDVEWLDDLDKLKESPGGYRQVEFYKNLLFRLYLDRKPVSYQGVGIGTLHEIWGVMDRPWKTSIYLPSPYAYTHRKSAIRIWRNSARNLVMAGGGDSVGDLNPMWVELRQIMKEYLHVDSWPNFESFIISKQGIHPKLLDWIKRALVFSATDYGTETRQTAKWICWHHRELLNDPEVKLGIANPPKPDPITEIEMYVRKMYFQVLNRHPDRKGLDLYRDLIASGKLKREDLQAVLMSSQEYKSKHPEESEPVEVAVPVKVDVGIRQSDYMRAFMRSRLWNEVWLPRLEVGRFLEEMVDKEHFYREFYKARELGRLDLPQLLKLIDTWKKEEKKLAERAQSQNP